MGNLATNVTAGKPKIGGAIFRAPLGTLLPTSAESVLDESVWKSIGYCSDDGVTNSNTRESDDVKAWGGDTVLTIQTEKKDTIQMTWIETMNVETLKAVHGDANVSGDLSTGIVISVNSKELTAGAYVIDMALRDDAIKRIVIPNAKISAVDDVVYSDEDVVGYPVTLTCMPDNNSNTHYEYIIRRQQQAALVAPTAAPEEQNVELFGTLVSDIQGTDLTVGTNAITGTLKRLTSGSIVDVWGEGNFVALKFSDFDSAATSVKVGLYPSQGSGLVEILTDPDKNGVFKVTDKNSQVIRTVTTDGTRATVKDYSLSGLTLES